MYRFSGVTYHPEANVAEVGAGLIWDDVYTSLEPFAVNVVGGRVSGVGVAGFTLGGGQSTRIATSIASLTHVLMQDTHGRRTSTVSRSTI